MVRRRRRPSSIDGDSVPRPTARWPKAPRRPLPRRTPSATRASEDRNSSGPSASTSVWSPPAVRWITPLDQTESRTGIAPATRTFDPRARVAGVCASAATASGIRSANRVDSRPIGGKTERSKIRERGTSNGRRGDAARANRPPASGQGTESVAASRYSAILGAARFVARRPIDSFVEGSRLFENRL